MRFFDGAAVDGRLAYPGLVDILRGGFPQGRDCAAAPPPCDRARRPARGHPLLMPAWEASAPGGQRAGRYLGVKSVTVFPDNAARGKPAVLGTYLLLSAETGETLAVMDATRLTAWRTGAASALASRYLSRPDAARLVMVGAGALAPQLVRAHASVRPIRQVAIWNRSPDVPARWPPRWRRRPASTSASPTTSRPPSRQADIVSTATLSAEPLIRGGWLAPGTHVDCVGAYRPDMRETDDDVVRRARIFVDTRAGAFGEAGDILQPLAAGVIGKDAVLGDLFDLTRGTVAGRASAGRDHALQIGRRRHRGPGRRHRRVRAVGSGSRQ